MAIMWKYILLKLLSKEKSKNENERREGLRYGTNSLCLLILHLKLSMAFMCTPDNTNAYLMKNEIFVIDINELFWLIGTQCMNYMILDCIELNIIYCSFI